MNTEHASDPTPPDTLMDGSSFNAAPGDDAWLESLLMRDAAQQPHIADGGFSARVIGALPRPSASVSRWLVPAMGVLGGVLALDVTPAGRYFAASFVGLFDLHHLSLANLWVLVPIGVMYICSFGAVRQR